MAEKSKAHTAFRTSRGLMEFNYMPFGLSTAECTFQKAMIDTLGRLDFVASYFDDILIFSYTWQEHVSHVKETLQTLKDAGFTVKPSKTTVGCTSIEFLGHAIEAGIVRSDQTETEKIRNLKIPATKKELRSVLGLLFYLQAIYTSF
ncbi:retrovirus-related Pol polyprotein from transposon opus [Elysia marginata]|uniref:Retrovirus-related Pol polyprotein from transposon opus n=1 Tax=Elysia marginata TaxID=1093978 RepID=A0AAV4EHB2_9GAST|nr:retrovirus-related Pol polyprotein from transposon opus [Elysia marginata]